MICSQNQKIVFCTIILARSNNLTYRLKNLSMGIHIKVVVVHSSAAAAVGVNGKITISFYEGHDRYNCGFFHIIQVDPSILYCYDRQRHCITSPAEH